MVHYQVWFRKAFPNKTPSKDPADFKKVFLETQLGACLMF